MLEEAPSPGTKPSSPCSEPVITLVVVTILVDHRSPKVRICERTFLLHQADRRVQPVYGKTILVRPGFP
jgi:hypothetical protein